MDIKTIFQTVGLPYGNKFVWTRTTYKNAHPTHEIYFNAHIYDANGMLLWVGDIDMEYHEDSLQKASDTLRTPLFIIAENNINTLQQISEITNEVIIRLTSRVITPQGR